MNSPAFLGETKKNLLKLLLPGEATAEALASQLDMNLSVVRRHLDDLTASELVQSSFKREKRGRPSKYYSITMDGRGALAAKYDVMADLLTTTIVSDLGGSKAKELFESAAEGLAKSVGKYDDVNSFLPVLEGFGFQPEIRKEGRKQLIISGNCPILKLSKKYPELACDTFHTFFCRKALNRPNIVLTQAISRGAKECIHEFS